MLYRMSRSELLSAGGVGYETSGELAEKRWAAISFPADPTFEQIQGVLIELAEARIQMYRTGQLTAGNWAKELASLKKKLPHGSMLRQNHQPEQVLETPIWSTTATPSPRTVIAPSLAVGPRQAKPLSSPGPSSFFSDRSARTDFPRLGRPCTIGSRWPFGFSPYHPHRLNRRSPPRPVPFIPVRPVRVSQNLEILQSDILFPRSRRRIPIPIRVRL